MTAKPWLSTPMPQPRNTQATHQRAAGHAIDDQQCDEDEGEHAKVDVKTLERGHATPGARELRLGS